MVKPRCPEPRVWMVYQRRWVGPRVKPTSIMLLDMYMQHQ
jgi:hypothetical protein